MYDAQNTDMVQSLLERLERLEQELRTEIESLQESSRPVMLDQQAVGRVSRGDAMQQQSMAQANLERCEQRLEQVNHALHRIASPEDYGYCENCDEPISIARLKAYPESRLCLKCQETFEQT
mgnify:FL=1